MQIVSDITHFLVKLVQLKMNKSLQQLVLFLHKLIIEVHHLHFHLLQMSLAHLQFRLPD